MDTHNGKEHKMTDVPPHGEMPPQPPAPTVAPQTNQGMAIVALVLGILGCATCGLFGIPGLIVGIIALVRCGNEPKKYGGRGMAIAGTVCSGASLLFVVPMMIAILLPSLSRARELSKRLVCAANMKGIGTTLMIYKNDHPGQPLPTLDELITAGDITPPMTLCPSSGLPTGNYILVHSDPPQPRGNSIVWMYEPASNHGGEGGNFLFIDGHVTFERLPKYDELIATVPSDQRAPTRRDQAEP